jgi:hypothetical protein
MPLAASVLLCSSLITANNLLGHYFAPSGNLLTPLVIMALTGLLLPSHSTYATSLLRVVLLALLICLHDAGIKLYAGGTHDAEGQGFLHAFLFLGLLPAYGYVVYRLTHQQAKPVVSRVVAGLLYPAVLGPYLWFFADLGYAF